MENVSIAFHVDCEQSLFFLQLTTRVRERRAAKPRDARNEGGSPRREKRDSLFSCLSRLAPSITRVCILARFVRRTKKKERLLVGYISWVSSGGKKKTSSQKHFLECVIYLSSSIGWNKMRKASVQQYTADERHPNCSCSYGTVCFYLILVYRQPEYFRTLLLLII